MQKITQHNIHLSHKPSHPLPCFCFKLSYVDKIIDKAIATFFGFVNHTIRVILFT